MEESISQEHIGHYLKKQREEKSLSIEEVAEHLRLKTTLISNIEHGNFDEIPRPYLRGYLRAYAKFLAIQELDAVHFDITTSIDAKAANWQLLSHQKQVSASNKFIQWVTFSIISILVILVAHPGKNENTIISTNELILAQQ